jgi:hypothetical protein
VGYESKVGDEQGRIEFIVLIKYFQYNNKRALLVPIRALASDGSVAVRS